MNAGPGGLPIQPGGNLPPTTACEHQCGGGRGRVGPQRLTTQTIASLSGVAGANVYLGGGTLTLATNSGSTTYNGSISDSGGASSGLGGSLVMAGNGTLRSTGR